MYDTVLTEELKGIVGYLPYDLHYHCEYYDGRKRVGRYHIANIIADLEYLPILRPLSDLYKTVLHNGAGIIPIVELAKRAFPELDFILYEVKGREEIYAQCGNSKRVFYNRGIFYEMDGYGNTHPIESQYLLIDYLHELKIDYRGLIDAGLAIDANTLESNPYK